ncbi:MAG: LruC domain-containing protein [Bacteroidota bacterium]|nr:LruC domain-containing protein [Bacteroidota bacterium]
MKNTENFSYKMDIFYRRFIILILVIGTFSCAKKQDEVSPNKASDVSIPKDINALVVSPEFAYNTTNFVALKVRAVDGNGNAIKGVVFNITEKDPQLFSETPILATGVTSIKGTYEEQITLPAHINKVYLSPNYIGLIDVASSSVQNKSLDFDLTVKALPRNKDKVSKSLNNLRIEAGVSYSYLGTWNSLGVPNYLESVSDVVDASFLADVNNALPELKPVPTFHPEYINTSNETDVILNDSADVWVTFVHEGAGWRNALGFYTYNLSNPPTSVSQIAKHTIIFPNASYEGSGGGLASGNKVKIGTFSKNTGIGWFLVANGWTGSTVGAGNYIHYSEPAFNIETNTTIKSHMVLLKNDIRNRVLIGFEDTRRDVGGCDNDFNDAIFYVTSNPYTAIKTQNVISMPTLTDSDNDGISNAFDMYPNDPQRGFDSYFPSLNTFGSLCFEDLWPGKGDYDFNDLVINYNFQQVMNGQNQIVDLKGRFVIKAIGASYKNGFGIQLPISSDKISAVLGPVLNQNLVQIAANGTEIGQNSATIIIFDNPDMLVNRTGGAYFNTDVNFSKGSSDTVKITINFNTPINASDLGSIPYNPFIIINQQRGIEVHLVDKAPTSLVTTSLLGTSDDFSSINLSKYYRTPKNLPFAINLPVEFDYPIEKSAINTAHLKFGTWAESSGASNPDWYLNNAGNRDAQKVYKK